MSHPPGLHWVLFDDDREIGRRTYIGYDDKGNPRGAHVEQEADKIIEQNARTRSFNDGRKWGDYKPVASVPLTLFEKAGLSEAVQAGDRRFLSKVLNDSDYSKFRTSEGKV